MVCTPYSQMPQKKCVCVKDGYTNRYICVWCVTIYYIYIIKCAYMDRERERETETERALEDVQLAYEQHMFDLHGFIYMGMFFKSKNYHTTQFLGVELLTQRKHIYV